MEPLHPQARNNLEETKVGSWQMRHTCRQHRGVQRMKFNQKIEVVENDSIHMVFETSSRYI